MNILVTGGASGLGLEITKKMAQGKNTVYFTYCRSVKDAEAIAKTFPNAKAVKCDFTQAAEVDGLLEKIPAMDLDVLVNNAALNIVEEHFHKMDSGVFLGHFTHLMIPTIRITQRAIQIFRKKKFGKIINILSTAVINKPPVGMSEYAALKSYLLSLSKSWAAENANFNITSNCVSPDFMQTKLTAYKDPRLVEQYVQLHPLKKALTPQEVADTVFFLGHCSQHINGINLVMNAAQSIS